MPREGYKMTGLGELPYDWEVMHVKDVTISHKQGYYTNKDYSKDNGTKLVRITDLLNHVISYETMPALELDAKTVNQFKINIGDFLIARSGAIGRYGIVTKNFPCVFGSYIIRFQFNPKKVDNFFFGYLYESNYISGQLLQITQGSSNININAENIKSIQIPLPPLPEQHRIAEILSTMDVTIEHTEALIKKYGNIKKGLMADLLTHGIDEEGRIRSEGTHRFKDSPLGRIPEEWEIDTIGSISTFVGSGVTPLGGSEVYKSSGIPLLRSQNIHFDGLRLDNVAYIDERTHNEMSRTHLKDKDVLLNITGASIGRCTFIPEGFGLGNVNQHVCIIRLNEENHHGFIENVLASPIGQKQIDTFQAGLSREGLNYQQVRGIKIPLPSFPEQQRIAEILIASDKRIEKEEAYKDKLLQIKKGLMQDLLTGRVRVKVPQEAVA